ncbi:pentatricopeptide repeat-containing protein At4g19191, mitochondrial isoform X1 [Durio zibethinus]|uniref:Pentatricopeptide repeat-containing protein At4g19191, mitochondrial isoform X1 n=1 Tax=Durio zibethinus TaxID=66656 RepID=A0A6P5XA35_DURZI|nr:pentatricopeptide repeat-containing protein At4g19191, mitochondrial isoform X1 [Durio zibethinus]XP_022724666.1 pentatricopeptide repeat-containing protein At4g19191, mitochondrial isoform X1 [Durio zibethinus]
MAANSVTQSLNVYSKLLTVKLWNSRIKEAVNQNSAHKALLLFRQMKQKGLEPNNLTFPFIAKACAKISNLKYSQTLHNQILKSPFGSDIFVQTALVDMYIKCDQVDYACKTFERMPERDLAAWNAMLIGFAKLGFLDKLLSLFGGMTFAGIHPDSVTVVGLSLGVLSTRNLELVKGIHSFGIQIGVAVDVTVANTWIAVYAKCGDLASAKKVFDEIDAVRTVISWNSMIAGYAHFENFANAFDLYRRMLVDGIKPDASSIVSLISSCVQPEALFQGMQIHSHGIQLGCDLNLSVTNTLISMYSKCGDLNSARFLFDFMSNRTCVSWTVMISGYAEKGNMDEAMTLFYSMEKAGETADLVTVLSLVSGCGKTGSLELGKCIDSYAKSKGFKEDAMVCNALIDMYSKCGSICEAREVFRTMPERTIVSWTTMISGCAVNGEFEVALDLFHQMRGLGFKPNQITFLAVLQACTHAGFLDKGWEFFNMMTTEYDIYPGLDHYSCMADLLGRKGKLIVALEFILNMPIKPDAGIWSALLSACKVHHNVEIGKHVASRLFEMEPQVAAPYVEMANIYASTGNWDEVAMIRLLMKHNNVSKSPGQSLVQVNGKTHRFTVEDRSHPEGVLIYALLDYLALQLKDDRYPLYLRDIPEMELV